MTPKRETIAIIVGLLLGLLLSQCASKVCAEVYGHRVGKDGISRTRWLFGLQPDQGVEWEHPSGYLHANLEPDGTFTVQATGNGESWNVRLVLESLCGNRAVLRVEDETVKITHPGEKP